MIKNQLWGSGRYGASGWLNGLDDGHFWKKITYYVIFSDKTNVLYLIIRQKWKVAAIVRDEVCKSEEAVGGDESSDTNETQEENRVGFVVALEQLSGLLSSNNTYSVSGYESVGKKN